MGNNSILYGLIGFFIGGLMVSAACTTQPAANTAVDHSTMDHSKMGHAMESAPGAAEAPYDLQFLDTMIVHHQGAIDMARLAATKAGHDELKNLSKEIITTQQAEIDQMKKMRDERFAGAASAVNNDLVGMKEGMARMDMTKLKSLSGTEFDIEFIDQMVPHHLGALIMSNDAIRKSENNDLKILAETILKAQGPEITKMNEWKKAWTGGDERPTPGSANFDANANRE